MKKLILFIDFYRNKQILYLNKYKKAMIHITKSVQQYLNSNDNINFKSSISCDPQSWKEGYTYFIIKNRNQQSVLQR